jgi:hypothetical protein
MAPRPLDQEAEMQGRSIVLWYVVGVVTFGIGFVVWFYKLNSDAKTLAGNASWKPWVSVLAITLGAIVIVPAYVSHWTTWSRVREATGAAQEMSTGLQFIFVFIPLVNLAYWGYLQSKLNAAAAATEPAAAMA